MRHGATRGGSRRARALTGRLIGLVVVASLGVLLVDCGGGGSSRAPGNGTTTPANLTAAQVQTIILQAVNEASARGTAATVAVVDRVGNGLRVMQMSGAPANVTVSSTPRAVASSGLERQGGIPH